MKIFTVFTIFTFIYFNYFLLFNFIETMKVENNKYNEIYNEYIKNFPELSNNYTLNATVVKLSYILHTDTLDYTGEVIMKYNNTIDNHSYCKINIEHSLVHIKEETIITNYMNYHYKLGSNSTNLYCNHEQCVYRLYYYDSIYYEPFYCHILQNVITNDEF